MSIIAILLFFLNAFFWWSLGYRHAMEKAIRTMQELIEQSRDFVEGKSTNDEVAL